MKDRTSPSALLWSAHSFVRVPRFARRVSPRPAATRPARACELLGRVFDFETKAPIKDAVLDTWQAANNGLYENQDEQQPDYNLRGRYRSDDNGEFELIALMPTAYPVPTDGPCGELLRAAKRPPDRPAHIHFIVSRPGFQTLVTQILVSGDEQIEEDAVFTASKNMIGDFTKEGDHFQLRYDFPLKRGESKMPKAPIPS